MIDKNLIQTETNLKKHTHHQLSKIKRVCLFLFLGGLIGDILVVTIMVSPNLSPNDIFDAQSYATLLAMLTIGYPVAIMIGGIPAILTALLIDITKTSNHEYVHAFIVGSTICLLFYLIPMGSAAFFLSGVGGVSTIAIAYLIKRIEHRKRL